MHPKKSGFIFVYDRADAKVENVYPMIKHFNFVEGDRSEDLELQGRRDKFCPAINGGVSFKTAGNY